MIRNYRTILDRVRKESPATAITVVGLLPINPAVSGPVTQDNATIDEANRQVKAMLADYPGVRFVDASGPLKGPDGLPRVEFYKDTIHLNYDGYRAIQGPIAASFAPAPDGPKRADPEGPRP